ncbi:hypothetical protein Tco_0064646 [Tanacetum coccineum]
MILRDCPGERITNTFLTYTKNHHIDRIPENTSENASGDPVMQFIVQNFKQINAMYSSFSLKRKEVHPTSIPNNDDHPIMEPWQSDLEGLTDGAAQESPLKRHHATQNKPTPKGMAAAENTNGFPCHKKCNQCLIFLVSPFMFKDMVVASPFTTRNRDYDMPDGLKVPTNLKTYDGTTDPDDHLTIFMGTMDVYKLPEPVWCRFFHITLSGATRFCKARFQKPRQKFLGIRPTNEESLRDFLQGREKIKLSNRAHNFIRADEANTENQLRHSRWVPNDNKSGQGYKDTSRRHKDKNVHHLRVRPNERTNVNNSSFTPLIKSPAEIYATSEGKAVLRPPSRMFAPAHQRDRTRYCEFHNDYGHDTNDCIDLRK